MSTAPLPDWQGGLAAAVLQPELPAPEGVRETVPGSALTRLGIYRNNALVPLVQSLEETFPACRHVLGAGVLRRLLIGFVRAHPPHSPVLQDYGQQFPGYLTLTRAGRAQPALVDLARLELLVVRAWHAADAPVLGTAEFAALLGDPAGLADLRFTLHPAARLLESAYPVGSLWLAERRGTSAAALAQQGGETVLVTRSDWSVEVQLLSPAEADLFAVLVCGGTLEEALAVALEKYPGADPAALLGTLISSGAASAVAAA